VKVLEKNIREMELREEGYKCDEQVFYERHRKILQYSMGPQGDSTKKIIKIHWYCGLLFGF
jgi:hypothetical protein